MPVAIDLSWCRRFALAFTVFFLVFECSSFAQSTLVGTYVFHVPNDDGTVQDQFLTVAQEGGSLLGTMTINYRSSRINDGTVKDGKVQFSIQRGRNRMVTYSGRLNDDRLELIVPGPDGSTINLTGERTSASAAGPPPPLPLPELHDVPDNGLVRTPPMGWNSWNHFHRHIDDATMRGIADQIVASGMQKAGYTYINIDDTWQGVRDASGHIQPNRKFPDMKALTAYVHSKGLKIGIYSSPGPTTCAGYPGSFGHEKDDAQSYADWGFDFLKYDWCSASSIYSDGTMQAVYQKMGDALAATGRPIVFSLCQYGRNHVWTWGAKVGGNSWRTTGDISDTWHSMSEIGFKQIDIAPFISAGRWNDPDMLEVGNGGMNDEEYRTHMTIWAMLAAPLLAGNDVRSMPEGTFKILTNTAVVAIDQDAAAKPARRALQDGTTEIWARTLTDGSTAVAIFNRSDAAKPVAVEWSKIGVTSPGKIQDLWEGSEVSATANYAPTVAPHGVVLLQIATHQ